MAFTQHTFMPCLRPECINLLKEIDQNGDSLAVDKLDAVDDLYDADKDYIYKPFEAFKKMNMWTIKPDVSDDSKLVFTMLPLGKGLLRSDERTEYLNFMKRQHNKMVMLMILAIIYGLILLGWAASQGNAALAIATMILATVVVIPISLKAMEIDDMKVFLPMPLYMKFLKESMTSSQYKNSKKIVKNTDLFTINYTAGSCVPVQMTNAVELLK